MEVDVIKEGIGRRNTDRNKMRGKKKEMRKYEKKREKKRTARKGENGGGGFDKMKQMEGEMERDKN